MRFLALSPIAAYALLAGVALAILLLHLLKMPPARVVIPSVLLWARIGRGRKRPPARRLLSLLLALGVGLSLALALTRPEIAAFGASAPRLALVLDNSPSMAARMSDGRSRWEHALEQARALLERSSAATEVRLLDTVGRLGLQGFVERDAAIAALGRVPAAAWGQARMPPASLLPGAQVHLFTDGVAQLAAPESAVVHAVFEPADNVAVTAFEVRPLAQDPTRYEALVQVLNASPGDRRVRLLITGGERFSIKQDLNLRAGESVNASFDVSDFEGGVLGAATVCATDAFALDDFAYAVIPPHRAKRVLLVSAGNPQLEDALRHVPGARLSVVTPERYRSAGSYEALVLDRFAPREPPAAGALLLAPPARAWLAGPSSVVAGPRITDWDENHAVAGGIAWGNLRLTRASVAPAVNTSEALVLTGGRAPGALVIAGKARARWVKVGFALQDSNFALQPDFPVFLGNALNWVTESTPVLVSGLGMVEVPLRGAQVRDGSGKSVPVSLTDQGVVFEAPRADVYTVSAPIPGEQVPGGQVSGEQVSGEQVPGEQVPGGLVIAGQVLVVANVSNPDYALINRTRLADAAATPVAQTAPARAWNTEPWMLLLLFAGALLLVEWTAFTRRFTA